MTKSMLEKCLNKEMRAFCALDEDVKRAFIGEGAFTEALGNDGKWFKSYGHPQYINLVYRLSPDTPTEQEYEEVCVFEDRSGYLAIRLDGEAPFVTTCAAHKRFIGIIYSKDGVETLRTSVDAAFGTPVRARFAKGDK